MTEPQFLNWLADRLVNVYRESENVDFVLKLRKLAKDLEELRENLILQDQVIDMIYREQI